MSFHSQSIFVFLICLSSLVSCKQVAQADGKHVETNVRNNGQVLNEQAYPKFEFTNEIHKFGNISEGEIVVCEFYFKNSGNANLIIKTIESSCGCTNIKWKKQPIKVGEESKITVELDSKKRHGKQYKVLTIFANTKRKVKELKITATIK